MRTAVLIQARISSVRLPGKVLHPFGDGTILDRVYDRSARIPADLRPIVVTSTTADDDAIARHCATAGWPLFRGSLTNVLERFVSCATSAGVDVVIRVCADNPYVDPALSTALVGGIGPAHDYAGYRTPDGLPAIRTGAGVFAEVARTTALMRLLTADCGPMDREHVTWGLYSRPEFACHWVDTPAWLPETLRLTCDYRRDYDFLRDVNGRCGDASAADVVAHLATDAPLAAAMARCRAEALAASAA